VVPARAVNEGLAGAFVYRVRDGKAEVVPVETRYRDEDLVVIARGVAPGDELVVDGQSRLRDGSAVKLVAPAGGADAAG